MSEPLHFDVVGAAGARRLFAHATPETLAHAYLFSGPAGVGKKTFALRLAQSLLCEAPKSGVLGYDGTCRGCAMVTSGTHPDLIVANGTLKIGEREAGGFTERDEMSARDLVRQFSLHAYSGGWRIFILGDVDFTREAANALLKFLEEPPPRVLILMTTSAAGGLLATIRSRSIEVPFPLLKAAEIVAVLAAHGITGDAAGATAAIAGGSATRALALAGTEGADAELGTRDAAIAWFYAVLERGTPDASWVTRETLDEGLETIRVLARDWLALRAAPDAPGLAPDQATRLRALAPPDPARLSRALAALTDAQRIAQSNVSPSLVMELARMALAAA